MKRSREENEVVAGAVEDRPLSMVQRLFPDLDSAKLATLTALASLVRRENARTNLISRKDVEHVEEHHIVMSLLMAKVWPKNVGTVLDIGTGGGFPGVPLAICFPETHFTLLDSIAKKCRAVQEVVNSLKLPNVTVRTARAENVKESFDMVIGRAVTALPEFLRWAGPVLKPTGQVLYFKGTRWAEELEGSAVRPKVIHDLETLLGEKSAFFEGKFILHFVAPIRMEDHITKSTNKNMHANEAKKKHKFQKKKGAK